MQLTPPGSECSIIIGDGITSDVPSSSAAASRWGRCSTTWGVFHHSGTEGRATGPDPERSDYGSFASFSDPDGNGWVLQEVKVRVPGR